MLEDKGINNISNSNISSNNYNIYIDYYNIIQDIKNLDKNINTKLRELDRLKGGPKDVKAQQYDSLTTSSKFTPVGYTYIDIAKLIQEIEELEIQKRKKENEKLKEEEVIKKLSKRFPKDIELKVFIGHHIKKLSLTQLSKKLKHFNRCGEANYYDYGYLKNINQGIKQKINIGVK
jgi:hypothetical protein